MTTRQADDGALGYGSPSVPHALQVFREVRDLGSADEDQGRGPAPSCPPGPAPPRIRPARARSASAT
ncbi:hypothetical protein ACFQZC_08285 [Streptacidiphilus monticola]